MSRSTLLRPLREQHDLLLAIAHPDTGTAAQAAERWSRTVDLDTLDFAAVQLLPMLSARTEPLPVEERLAAQIANVSRVTWLRTESHARVIAPALARLSEAACDPVLMKGAALVYGHGAPARVRPMWDFDVLVDPARLTEATRLLLEEGFRARDATALLAGEPRILMLKHGEDFRRRVGESIDLHWSALQSIRRPGLAATLSANAVATEVAGAECRALGRTDLLAVTIAHAADPARTMRERWVGDCLLLVRGHEIDWELLAVRGRDWRLAQQVLGAFDYLKEVAELDLPDTTRRQLARCRTPIALRIRRRGTAVGGRPASIGHIARLFEDYEAEIADRVPFGARTGPGDFLDFLVRRAGLTARHQLIGEAAFVLAGRPWRTRRRLRSLWPRRMNGRGCDRTWPVYEPGARLRFGGELPTTEYLGAGWWFPEDFGTWSRGAHSRLGLRLDTPISGDARLELGVYGLIGDGHERVEVDVVVNEFRLVTFAFDRDNQAQELAIAVPSEVISGRSEATIDFVVRHPAVPAEIGTAPDMRQIGFGLGWLALAPAPAY